MYLKESNHHNLATLIRKLKPAYLTMPWQTENNANDRGIFLKRHMETYKSDPKIWVTNFDKKG